MPSISEFSSSLTGRLTGLVGSVLGRLWPQASVPAPAALAIPAFFAYDTPENQANWQKIIAAGSKVGIVVPDQSFSQFDPATNPDAVAAAADLWRSLRSNGVAVLGYALAKGGQLAWEDAQAAMDVKRQVDPWATLYGELISGIYLDVGPVASDPSFNEASARSNYEAYYQGVRAYSTEIVGVPGEVPWRVMVNAAQGSFDWLPANSDWQLVWEASWKDPMQPSTVGYAYDSCWGYLDSSATVQRPVPSWWIDQPSLPLATLRRFWDWSHPWTNIRTGKRVIPNAILGWADFRTTSHTVPDCPQSDISAAYQKAAARGAGMIWFTDSATQSGNTSYTFPSDAYWQALLAQLPAAPARGSVGLP